MSSRDYTRHTVTLTTPAGSRVGDEYFDVSTNRLYKILAIDGVTLTAREVVLMPANSSNVIITNYNTITSNVVIPAGTNGFSVGPVVQLAGTTVTVTPGQRWVVI